LTPAFRRALVVSVDSGAVVQDVTTDTPAERSGLRSYDVIVSVDNVAVRTDEELIRHIAGRTPGTTTTLGVVRDGVRQKVVVKLTERPLPESTQRRVATGSDVRPASARDQGPLGL